jgi:transposase-like protein
MMPLIKQIFEAALGSEMDAHINAFEYDGQSNRRNGKIKRYLKLLRSLFSLKSA